MKIALREAKKGIGRTSPNPCVGAVVVKNGKVVGKGWHRKAGTPHAEVNALQDAGNQAKNSTIYVTLEPCNHTGRTPPCTEAIIAAGIKRVVVGMADPNPVVTGGGNKFLVSKGIVVSTGILEDECRAINRPFIKHIRTGLPWVIMKAGVSLDGRIATRTGHSSWITNDKSRAYVHRLRDQVDAILVGIGTALSDDPSLTTRLLSRRGRDSIRVILDTHLRLPPSAKVLRQDSLAPTVIFCGPDINQVKKAALAEAGAIVKQVTMQGQGLNLAAVLAELGKMQVMSLLVEGGSDVHGSFLKNGLFDQANLFLAPVLIGSDGVPLLSGLGVEQVPQAPRLNQISVKRFDNDLMIEGFF
ncbi:MAG: bifunctional diaminohydroxyphosphoribosylaminopyrimidine deaminase/5-amino-6-(5-phosphoribosylamino)uracil reductase RibD [Proteobacteria bacterium]|nr:bifunctional diaminohydroxyphosphoribosylaminopyrimidine deaminase/5-amino-6-(5-phosphoribosylamino)uracil reductase RibD [Pseudomonadota bacterium]MBU1716833.1 bifunctional diaminohydroxyphosphoribosylaminopyrimidine deaminase/5-amino-6-(5-phosphoribosylamino)uracil reductase RibD [Pseudomonadota bacterium]